MKKRLIKKRKNEWIRWIADYTEVPVKIIRNECGLDIENLIRRKDQETLDIYLDCVSIDLMQRYQCGWWWESHKVNEN
ncbi:hypothetical protein [Paenibacillus elgii]|uniref:hypothetical protein n=1 Tax=Paenibacillus elgii TaxID=189691 RepID=UPI000248CFA4|nr:hypothetical protein [Paenibacillus elgii]